MATGVRLAEWRQDAIRAVANLDHPSVLAALRASLAATVDAWVAASQAAKGWQHIAQAQAEEWCSGPLPIARYLAALASRAHLQWPSAARSAAPSLPGLGDGLLLRGHRATLQFGNPAPNAMRSPTPGVALVLGAGNVTATPWLDVLDQIFVHGRAVVLKPSPLHAPLLPVFARAFAPLHDAGVLLVVPGDAELGRGLAHDAAITAVHLTGSADTWRQLDADPALADKERTAEVGCSTPAFVLPHAFAVREVRAIADQLAAYVAMNGGGTCLAPRVLLLGERWPLRDSLLAALRAAFARLPARVPFHPSAREHWQLATGRPAGADALAPTLAIGDARAPRHCDRELFAPVLRVFELADAGSPDAFARHAAAFVRTHGFGSLSAYVFSRHPDDTDTRQLIEALPHGTVAVNTWTGLGYGLGTTPWGVPPGAPRSHGSGFARHLAPRPIRRIVVSSPLRPWPTPPWLPHARHGEATLRALTLHTLRPSLGSLLRTTLHALR